MNLACEPTCAGLEKFVIYETQQHLYVVGCDRQQLKYRVLKVLRRSAPSLIDLAQEDASSYSKDELRDVLEMAHEGNKQGGGLRRVATGYGILGFVRFLDCYYCVLITQRRKVGRIGGAPIYGIKATELIPIRPAVTKSDDRSLIRSFVAETNRRLNPTQRETAEQRYLSLFQFVDLSKDFYFSYAYDLTQTLQHVMHAQAPLSSQDPAADLPPPEPSRRSSYAWNHKLVKELRDALGSSAGRWCVTLVHGAFVQRTCALFGRSLVVTLIARRSRHFAGTRYLKRGASDTGAVANDVELEQITHAPGYGAGGFASYVQVRGSIPIFWTQATSVTLPKPPIIVDRVDPTYTASQKHFADLLERYGGPCMVLDLTKHVERRARETVVSAEFRRAIECVNTSLPSETKVRYCALDFSAASRSKKPTVLDALSDVAAWTLDETRFFQCQGTKVQLQRGVLRSNCIDCLDRTNVAQFAVGAVALARCVDALGFVRGSSLEPGSRLLLVLMELYSAVGDALSLQYGGSEAHKRAGIRRGESVTVVPKHQELLTSIRRYYSNAFTDRLKQDAINVFLGTFTPSEEDIPLWDLDSDYYLHNVKVQEGCLLTMAVKKDAWLSDSEEDTSEDVRARVVRRCNRRDDLLSKWWRDALQTYDASLQSTEASNLEEAAKHRFERVHQPSKLTQFDKILQADSSTPVPLAADDASSTVEKRFLALGSSNVAALAIPDDDDDEGIAIEEEVSKVPETPPKLDDDLRERASPITIEEESDDDDPCQKAERLVRVLFGASPQTVEGLEAQAAASRAALDASIKSDSTFVGRLQFAVDTRGERQYGEYARVAADPGLLERPSNGDVDAEARSKRAERAHSDMTEALKERDLRPSDCAGVLEASRAAGVSKILESGKYEGLPQSCSARDVCAAVLGEVEVLAGPVKGDRPGDDVDRDALRKRLGLRPCASLKTDSPSLDAPGVVHQVEQRLEELREAHAFYARALDPELLARQRSSLSTDASVALYCTHARSEDWLRDGALAHCLRSERGRVPARPRNRREDALDAFDRDEASGLYQRRDNRYMLFNEAGARAALPALEAAAARAREQEVREAAGLASA